MVYRVCSGAPRSCEGKWDSTNRWIRKKLTRDLRTSWRQQDLDVPARKNRWTAMAATRERRGLLGAVGRGIEASAVTVRYSSAADVG